VTVVSNSSPLIAVAKIRLFHLLQRLFGKICIPSEVYIEVVIKGAGLPGATETQNANWIHTKAIGNTALFTQWRTLYCLGPGEVVQRDSN
jgi:uncharacterized protein